MRALTYPCSECPETFITALELLEHSDFTGHAYRIRRIPLGFGAHRVEPSRKRTVVQYGGFQWEVTS